MRVLWVILLALGLVLAIPQVWRAGGQNRVNAAYLELAKRSEACLLETSPQVCPQAAGEMVQTLNSLPRSGCQALWASRLMAVYSLEAAQEALALAQGCPRLELAALWEGELAWQSGDRSLAQARWEKLGANDLIDLAYAATLQENTAKGRFILDIVLARPERLYPSQLARALARMGYAYYRAGEWENAIPYYQQALQIEPGNVESLFYLGLCQREAGQWENAILTLNEGLPQVTKLMPGLISDYYVQLGLAYRLLGKRSQALEAFTIAYEWWNKAPYATPGQNPFLQGFIDELSAP